MFVVRAKRLVVRGMERQPAIATRGPSRQPCFSASHSRGARTSRSNGREEARPAHARRPRPLARLEHLNPRVSGRAACDRCHRKQAKPVAGPAVCCPLSTGHGRRTWFAVRRLATALPGVAPGLTHVHLRRLLGGHFQPSHRSRSPRAMSLAPMDRCRPALGDPASRPREADQWPAAVTRPNKRAGRALACDAKRSRLGQHAMLRARR